MVLATDSFARALGTGRGADKNSRQQDFVKAQENLKRGDIRAAISCLFNLSYSLAQRQTLKTAIVDTTLQAAVFNIEQRYEESLAALGLHLYDIREDAQNLVMFRNNIARELLTCKNEDTSSLNAFYKNISFDLLVYQSRNIFPDTREGRRNFLGGRGYNFFIAEHNSLFPNQTFSDYDHDQLLKTILAKPHVIEHIDKIYSGLDEAMPESDVFSALRVGLTQHLCSKIRQEQTLLCSTHKRNATVS